MARFKIRAPLGNKKETLPVQFAINVPSTVVDKEVPTRTFNARVREVKSFLNDTFGGTTRVRAVGSDVDREEKVLIVESSATREQWAQNRTKINSKMKLWREKWNQEGLFFTFEDKAFIFPNFETQGKEAEKGKFQKWKKNFSVNAKT